jgi:hypothetical protein
MAKKVSAWAKHREATVQGDGILAAVESIRGDMYRAVEGWTEMRGKLVRGFADRLGGVVGGKGGMPDDVRGGVAVLMERIDTESMRSFLGYFDEDPDRTYSKVDKGDVVRATAAVKWLCEQAGIVPLRRCTACGCTEEDGCASGCWWIDSSEEDLCSACVPGGIDAAVKQAVSRRPRKVVARKKRNKSCRRR